MKTVGLITEYNPFHKGHGYHIEESKRISGADTVIVVMSGNYVQRGEPAFMDKYTRAQVALDNGADLIIELPVIYATASAEIFARGAVSILSQIGITDSICFGAEHANMEELSRIAHILAEEPTEFKELLRNYLKTGVSFPIARTKALTNYLNAAEGFSLLSSPNNILGIEYLKALLHEKSNIQPYSIPRIHSGYHAKSFDDRYYSATAIRNIPENEKILETLMAIDSAYTSSFEKSYPIRNFHFNTILGEKLMNACTNDSLSTFLDVTDELSFSIKNKINQYTGFSDFIMKLKTKNVTYSRLSRCLLHIMLDIKEDMVKDGLGQNTIPYVRVLGFSDKGSALLKNIPSEIAILTKTSGYKNVLRSPFGKRLFEQNLYSDNLYRLVAMNQYKQIIPNEFNQKILKAAPKS